MNDTTNEPAQTAESTTNAKADNETKDAPKEDSLEKDVPMETSSEKENQEEKEENMETTATFSYTDYSEDVRKEAAGKRHILFFHAAWCPTCKKLDTAIKNASSDLAGTVLKVDYDNELELRKEFGITLQHTLVVIDKDGNVEDTIVGGTVEDIKAAL